ncbi:unnamed protein product [Prorocentrum cordatum]|uniref:Uncharacterized protein n=1 Tax=Prorocentrum cordatum TaxID=2364126 RepID=A0ABN9SFR1_9DINO|nr:unnamed protein product [Polarella glacialis]
MRLPPTWVTEGGALRQRRGQGFCAGVPDAVLVDVHVRQLPAGTHQLGKRLRAAVSDLAASEAQELDRGATVCQGPANRRGADVAERVVADIWSCRSTRFWPSSGAIATQSSSPMPRSVR